MPAMFASSDADRPRLAVTLTLASGETLNGNLAPGLSGKLKDILNNADRFLEIETREGRVSYILKDDIRAACLFELPRTDQLARRMAQFAGFDPWLILGLDRSAGPAEVRTAYWAKAKQYHPDKFVDTDAPREVVEFMNAMFSRIHTAYKELSGEAAPAE